MSYPKDCTTIYTINGHEYKVTAPALFDSKTNKQAFEDYNLVSSDAEINDLLQKIDEDYSDYTASGLSRITHRAGPPWSMTEKGKPIKDQLIFDQFTKT